MEKVKQNKGNEVLKRHFNDILLLYKNIYDIKKVYDYSRKQLLDIKASLERRRRAVRGARGWLVYLYSFIVCVALAAAPWLCGLITIKAAGLTALILSVIVYFSFRLIYEKVVVPRYIKKTKIQLSSVEDDYWKSYRSLTKLYECFDSIMLGLDEECRSPLAIYIMLQAVQSEECFTLHQCVLYFQSRYKTLQDDNFVVLRENKVENPKELKRQLDKEALDAEDLIEFLKGLVTDMMDVAKKGGIISEPKITGGDNHGKR